MTFRTCSPGCLLALVAFATCATARADVLLLVDGGRVRGEWLNPGEAEPDLYKFRTRSGVQLSFPASEVREAHTISAKAREYQQVSPTFPDTAEGQWRLAEWCRCRNLTTERESRLRRILELEPNHLKARRALGYSQVDGQWVTQESFFRERGYQLYRGRWLSPQEILLMKRDAEAQRQEKAWYARLKRARKLLAESPNRDALETLQSATDPSAVYGLAKLWEKEPSPEARRLYAATLARIQSPAAVASLVNIALRDPDYEVFHECMDRLKKEKAPEIIDSFVRGLDSNNNAQVNRAAEALSQFRDPSTVDSLIGALVTTHSRVVGNGSPDQMTSTFGAGPGGATGSAFKAGGDRKVYRERIPNENVLSALVAITGQSFGFNQQAWKAWWSNRREQ